MTSRSEARPGALRATGVALVLGIVSVEVVLALGYYALATTLPAVAHSFSADSAFSLAAAAALVTSIPGLVLAGSWSDRAGPVRPLLAGFAALATGSVLCAAAPAMGVFVVGRMLHGLGTGLVGVALYGVISHLVAEEHRGFVFGQLNAAWLLPSLIGPVVVGAMTDLWGWRVVYGVVALLIVVSGLVLAGAVRGRPMPPHDQVPGLAPWRWALVLTAGTLALHLAGERATGWGLGVAVAGLAATAIAVRRVLPAVLGAGARVTSLVRLLALRAALMGCVAGTEVYVPFYLQRERGFGLAVSGLVIAATSIGWAAGAQYQTRLVRRLDPPRLLRWAAALVPVGPLVTLVVVLTGGSVPWLVAGLLVMGVGMGTAFPVISTTALAVAPPERHASVGGALQLAEAVAAGVTLAATGLLLGFLVGLPGLVAAYVVLSAVGLVAVVVAPRRSDTPVGSSPRR